MNIKSSLIGMLFENQDENSTFFISMQSFKVASLETNLDDRALHFKTIIEEHQFS